MRARFTTLLPLAFTAAAAIAQQRSITYAWLNAPCAEVLHCESGCSACNMPTCSDAAFFGTNAAWLGVSTCPHPFAAGDNAVFTEGWDALPQEGKGLVVSLIALAPTALDTIVVRHRSWGDGPQRLRVSLGLADGAWTVLHDGPATTEMEKLVVGAAHCLAAQEGLAYGYAQLLVQAYGGGDGAWVIDELRIAGSACQPDLTTGIGDPGTAPQRLTGPWHDALGRPVGERPASGVYQLAGRRMVVLH